MRASSHPLTACLDVLVVALVGSLVAACGGRGKNGAPATAAQQAPATQTGGGKAAQQQVVQQVKACSLFTKAEIEKATGCTVADPVAEDAGPLSTCSFGDPTSPKVATQVAVSFDAHERDPLGGLRVTTAGYTRVVSMLHDAAVRLCHRRIALVTEGVYDLGVLRECLEETIRVLA